MLGARMMMSGHRAIVTFTESDISTSDLTEYTFSSKTLGSGDIVIAVSGQETASVVSTVVVDGSSVSLVIAENGASNKYASELWRVNGITNSTGTVVVTFTTEQNGCGIGIYLLKGANTSTNDTKSSSDETNNSNAITATVDVPLGGICIAHVCHNINAVTWTWSKPTETFDEVINSDPDDIGHTGASESYFPEQPTLAVSATPSGNTSIKHLVAASWGPS